MKKIKDKMIPGFASLAQATKDRALLTKRFVKFIDVERIIHSIKTVIACLIGLLLTKIIGLPADQWVIITIIVVMCAQIYVGSVLQKAYLRFLGTLIGCLFAAFTLIALGDTPLAIAVAIGLSSFIFSYLATNEERLSYAGTLGAVTTTIIMLGQQPTVLFALQRFLEISLGILIATLVSQFIMPINARTHLKRAQADSLQGLRDYYLLNIAQFANQSQEKDILELDEELVKSLMKQRQLAKESASEHLGGAFDQEHFSQSLYCEREMLRAITFMHHALTHVPKAATLFIQSSAAHAFNDAIVKSFTVLTKDIPMDKGQLDPIAIPLLTGIKQEILHEMPSPTREELIYLDGFLFSAELLTDNLAKLARLYEVPIYKISSS